MKKPWIIGNMSLHPATYKVCQINILVISIQWKGVITLFIISWLDTILFRVVIQIIINGDLQLYKMNVSRLNDVIYIDMYTNQVMGFIIATFVDTAHTHSCAPYKCI